MGKKNIWFLALVAAMGGFLFGYDTAVINGAEKEIQNVFNLSSTLHGLVMSSAIWGTVLGALLGGRIADRIGRKPTLLCIGALYLCSAVWSGFAGSASTLFIARFIGGLGVGCSSVVAPVYIAVEKNIPEVIFSIFGAFMIIHLLWAIFVVPETKGKSLEELSSTSL